MLRLPPDHYINDFIAALLAEDVTAMADLRAFLVNILGFALQRKKFHFGPSQLYLGMEVCFSTDGIHFVSSENRWRKYVELLEKYLKRGELFRP